MDTREKFFSLGNNTWLLYSIGTIATNYVCPKAGTLSPLMIKSGQSIAVTPGRHIPTMDHIITADEIEQVKIVTSWLYWIITLSQLFNHHDRKELTAKINDIRHQITKDFDASCLLQILDSVQKPFLADHWLFSLPAAMIRKDIIITVISILSGKNAAHSHHHKQLRNQWHQQSVHLPLQHHLRLSLQRQSCFNQNLQLSLSRNQPPRSSFTPKRGEGTLSFQKTLCFTWTFIFIRHFISLQFILFFICISLSSHLHFL
jgi:hypothetical protein